MEQISLGLAFVAGLLSFLSPCVLPLVPAYIGYLGGRMTAAPVAGGEKPKGLPLLGRMQLVIHGLAFVAGFTTIFVLMGAVVSVLFVGAAPVLKDMIGRVGGVLIIVFGLHSLGLIPWLFKYLRKNEALLKSPLLTMIVVAGLFALVLWAFGTTLAAGLLLAALIMSLLLLGAFTQPAVFWPRVLDRFDEWFYADTRADISVTQRSSLVGSFTMGLIFAAGWTPCIGPMLGSIMGIAAQGDQLADGLLLFTAYSLGLGVPFLATALLLEPMQALLRRVQRSMKIVKMVSGLLMIVIGILVARGDLALLSQNLGLQFADLSARVEDCGTGVFAGTVSLAQVGDCVNGVLVPVNLNQGQGAALTEDTPQMTYLVTLAQPLSVDVELSRVSDPKALRVTLKNADNEVLAQSETLIRLDEKRFAAITDVDLAPGQYQIVVSRLENAAEKIEFRVKMRAAEALPEQPVTLPNDDTQMTNPNSPIIELAVEGAAGLVTAEATPVIPPVNEGIQGPASLNTITGAAEASGPIIGTRVGQRAPNFTITLDNGETVTLADLRGRVVLLNFWGTWCGPCRREMPDFEALYQTYQDEGFIVLALAARDTAASVAAFRDEYDLTFWLALDEEERVNDLYDVPGQPSTFLIDEEGVIVYQTYSVIDADVVGEKIEETLGQ